MRTCRPARLAVLSRAATVLVVLLLGIALVPLGPGRRAGLAAPGTTPGAQAMTGVRTATRPPARAEPRTALPPPRGAPALEPGPLAPTDARRDGLVRVHGRVHQAGAPVPLLDLSFVPLASGSWVEEAEWDLTSPDGRYDVRLAAGRYAVLNGEDGRWITDARVPPTAAELALDIHLSVGELGPR